MFVSFRSSYALIIQVCPQEDIAKSNQVVVFSNNAKSGLYVNKADNQLYLIRKGGGAIKSTGY